MYCMKCGQEISEGRVFCPDCLADMEKYPVKPGATVILPQRFQTAAQKKQPAKKRVPTPEELLEKYRKLLRVSLGLWLVTLLLAAALAYPAYLYVVEEEHFLPGQNYSVFEQMLPTAD